MEQNFGSSASGTLFDTAFNEPAREVDFSAAAHFTALFARLLLQKDPQLAGSRGQAVQTLRALFDWKPEGPDAG